MVFLVILKKVVLKKERTAIWDFTRTNFSHSAEESRNWAIFANTTWKLSARGMPSDIFPHITAETLQEKKGMHCHQCTMCCLYSIFSSQPNEVGHDLTPHNYDIIQHILIPTRSVARKTLLWTFSWASNSKFEIFLELYPCSNYRILAFFTPISVWIHGNSIIPPYHTQGDFGYRGILLYKQHIVHWTCVPWHPWLYRVHIFWNYWRQFIA